MVAAAVRTVGGQRSGLALTYEESTLRHIYRFGYLFMRLIWRFTNPVTIGVRLLLVKDNQALLVQHTYQPDQWFFPGGGVKKGETIEQAARREAAEEVGADLGILSLRGIFTHFGEGKSDHVIVLSCEDFSLSGISDQEIERCRFFPLTQLPEGMAPGHRRRIDEYLHDKTHAATLGKW
jgi:8-oxo-dGTP pyrophosphatase MutT (NUDIX family)